jgi:hypothetical protein
MDGAAGSPDPPSGSIQAQLESVVPAAAAAASELGSIANSFVDSLMQPTERPVLQFRQSSCAPSRWNKKRLIAPVRKSTRIAALSWPARFS